MFSLGSHLALHNSSMLHSFVDSFFLGKKALVKDRLRQSMETIVDGLFEEMVDQVKEMLLPPKEGASNDQVKPFGFETTTFATPAKATTSNLPVIEKQKNKMIFATKSNLPGPSSSNASQPFSGFYKRMAESDGGNNSQPNKKKAVTVELQIDDSLDDEYDYGDVALDEGAGGGDTELANISATPINNASNASNEQPHQPTQSGKFPCTEPNCTKTFRGNADLKRHLRTHNNAKPFGCTFPGCSLEFALRGNAIRHILNVHLKKKPGEPDKEGEEDLNEPPDPATYLSIKEELL
ncbi:PREDICTED: protein glass-like [Rhagoletis zephyria]|uniref:protein glass-like n=1 Tax=Rhagoletis zephyria TaxID=28612 RepID=UPI000811949D|nr:PREDICTED: protein glass-like [Rhagoletis zephyria]